MASATIQNKKFTNYAVRRKDLCDVRHESNRIGVAKGDFLSVLLRGWRKLTPQQQLESIPPVSIHEDAPASP